MIKSADAAETAQSRSRNAGHDRRDAEREGGGHRRIPGNLRVVVSVDIDYPRHQREAAGIDRLGGGASTDVVDSGDTTAGNSDVRAPRIMAKSVDNRRATDQQLCIAISSTRSWLFVLYRRQMIFIAQSRWRA